MKQPSQCHELVWWGTRIIPETTRKKREQIKGASGHGLRRRPKETREEVACCWWLGIRGLRDWTTSWIFSCPWGYKQLKLKMLVDTFHYISGYMGTYEFPQKPRFAFLHIMRMGQYHIHFWVGWTSTTPMSYPQAVSELTPIQNLAFRCNLEHGRYLSKAYMNHTFAQCVWRQCFHFVKN